MNKPQAFQRFSKNQSVESFRMLWDMQEKMPQIIKEAVANIEKETTQKIQKLAEEEINIAIQSLPDLVQTALMDTVNKIKKGEDGYTPLRGKDYFTKEDETIISEFILKNIPAPIKGDKGDSPTKKELVSLITPLIPKPIPGLPGKDGSSDTAEEIKNKVLSLETPWLPKEAIIGLEKMFNALQKKEKGGGSGGGGSSVQYYDLTSQCNGVLKTFTIPRTRRILGVFGTQFPVTYRPVTDWTNTETTLTLTSEVGAPETSQTLYILHVPISSL